MKPAPSFAAGLLLSFLGVACPSRAANYAVTLLHPNGFDQSNAYGAFGIQQVGWAWQADSGIEAHAVMWSGAASTSIDLHPTGFIGSYANSASNTQQIGYGHPVATFDAHALLWTGSAASVVDLHPEGYALTFGWAVSEDSQVGFGYKPDEIQARA